MLIEGGRQEAAPLLAIHRLRSTIDDRPLRIPGPGNGALSITVTIQNSRYLLAVSTHSEFVFAQQLFSAIVHRSCSHAAHTHSERVFAHSLYLLTI